ncbi:MAG: response regulator [Selenomonadaceae bacterium]|nr:response regulator [Selenomonadaceae bacterium]
MNRAILIVDDAEMNRDILRMFFEEQYTIYEAADGDEAIKQIDLHSSELSLILLDQIMPKKNGIEVLDYMKRAELIDYIPVIMITGDTDDEVAVQAYEYSAADIIYKPFNQEIIMRRSQNLIEQYENRNRMEQLLDERTRELRESQEKLAKNNEFLINALGSVVEFRSLESGEHIQRVKGFTKILLKYVQNNYPEYNLTDSQINMISSAAALHDVGKIAVPDAVLNKPGKLTYEEFNIIKRHTIYGCQILEQFKQDDSEFYKYCYDICRWHHEKYDGNGYPDRLSGEDIPIWAQVVAVADCFDALVSKRVYKDSYPVEKAMDMINNGECGAFSDKIMDCFDLARYDFVQAVQNSEFTYTNVRRPSRNVETIEESKARQSAMNS